MRYMSDWIVGRHFADDFGPLWPPRVALEHLDVLVLDSTRPSWCYGVPGLARALYLAGRALADGTLCDLSLAALKGVFRRERASWSLESPTVCHGRAGLLQITMRMAHDTGDAELRRWVASLTADLVAAFDETAPFGYRNVERIGDKVALVDKVGVLEGVSGVALALNSAAAPEKSPLWDAALLVA